MMLLVDIGNTRIKWARWSDSKLSDIGALALADWSDEQLANDWRSYDAQQIWVANVAGAQYEARLHGVVARSFTGRPIHFVRSTASACGIKNAYQDPASLGVDRWLALIAAHRLASGPVCVVNAGTAVTIDQLATDGTHLGGLIIPGINLMIQALNMHTNAIKVTDFSTDSAQSAAIDTRRAVSWGAVRAVTATIEAVLRENSAKGNPMRCLISGGDAELIGKQMTEQYQIMPHIVLHGLGIVASQSGNGTT